MPSIEYFASATENDIGAKACYEVDTMTKRMTETFAPTVFKELVCCGKHDVYAFRHEAVSAAIEFVLDCKMVNTANALGLKIQKERTVTT